MKDWIEIELKTGLILLQKQAVRITHDKVNGNVYVDNLYNNSCLGCAVEDYETLKKRLLEDDLELPRRSAGDYTYSVDWTEDGDYSVYIARVAEFKSLSVHGDTPDEALEELKKVVKSVLVDLEERGELAPDPGVS